MRTSTDYCTNLELGKYIDVIESPISKLRTLCVWLGRSSQRANSFKDHCKTFGGSTKIPDYDVPTRWNSTYRMIKEAINSRVQISTFLRIREELQSLILAETDWEFLNEILSLLSCFETLTLKCSLAVPHLWRILPLYYVLDDRMDAIINGKDKYNRLPDSLRDACRRGQIKFKKYYDKMDSEISYFIGVILDPRLKTHYLTLHLGKETATDIQYEARNVFTKRYMVESTVPESVDLREGDEDIDNLVFGELMATPAPNDEWDRYITSPRVPFERQDDIQQSSWVLDWWRKRAMEYPGLSRMARDYLAIPGASESVERLFNTGRDVLSLRRLSLGKNTLKMIMILIDGYRCRQL
jgi:hypothetical protein